ncbi:hypothetical protein MICRO11B_410013 [Micrococcus luteus]|nr:hypothetical protein MICRO11B_410013 [Micrococcus luteus]
MHRRASHRDRDPESRRKLCNYRQAERSMSQYVLRQIAAKA